MVSFCSCFRFRPLGYFAWIGCSEGGVVLMATYPDQSYPETMEVARGGGVSLREVLMALRRYRWLILGCGILGSAAGTVTLLSIAPSYTAETSIVLDARKPRVTDLPSLVAEQTANPEVAQLRSEVEILQSENLARRVIDRLALLQVAEFQQRPSYLAAMVGDNKKRLAEALSGVAPWLPALAFAPANVTRAPGDGDIAVADAVQAYRQHLSVTNDGRTYVITLRYTSHDPMLAARIVNTHVQLYFGDQIAYKREIGRQTSSWLTNELSNLQAKLRASEEAVQRFREENQIVQSGDTTLVSQQLAAVNAQVPTVENELANAESRLKFARDLLRRNAVDTQSDVLESRLVQRLREEEAAVQRRIAEIRTIYGDAHPNVTKAQAELRDLQDSIRVAVGRITKNLETEVQVARTRRNDLQHRLLELEQRTVAADRAGGKLRDLQREVTANNALIELLLTRFKQVGAQEEIQQPDARIISTASAPIKPSFPKLSIHLPIIFAGSLVFGVSFAFLRELMRRGFKGSNEIEIECDLRSLGSVPVVPRAWPRTATPQDLIIDQPRSSFAESVAYVRNAIQAGGLSARQVPKTFLITSSLPREGKSVLAISLARSFARMGKRTLLIDCDVRNPTAWKLAGITNGIDIAKMLNGEVLWQEAASQDSKSTLHVIGADGTIATPHDLVSSMAMRTLLEQCRRRYDIVILDSPPVTAVSDALTLSRWADATMLVVRWGVTPREIAKTSLNKLFASGARLCGAVLTQVDMRRGVFSPAEPEYYHRENRRYYIG
jgi:polysaccharide biosynthesis transport protein